MPRLLTDSDPPPVEVFNEGGAAPYVLTCEHAGREIPRRLDDMGLDAHDRERHIAWDIGAGSLARLLAAAMDAPVVVQRYSRLVIDCNRPLEAEDSIPRVSDGTQVSANAGLSVGERERRAREIHAPYHEAIAGLLDERTALDRPTAVIAVHSFTPRLESAPAPRPWDLGLLHNRHRALPRHAHDVLGDEAGHLNFTFNEPYRISDLEDFTIPVHGEQRGLPNMLLEVRNDHIADEDGQRQWARLLARVLDVVSSRLWCEDGGGSSHQEPWRNPR